MKTITLTRFSYAPDGTFGRLELPGGTVVKSKQEISSDRLSTSSESEYVIGGNESPLAGMSRRIS